MILYRIRDLKKIYGYNLALDIPTLDIEKGSAVVLQGPNGSGKSTFLRLLAFLEAPSTGSLEYFGSSEPRKECTLLLQEPWLMHASVFSNVTLPLKLRGLHGGLNEKYQMAMQAVGFEDPSHFAKRKPVALSGGEKQRVTLASRLIFHPSVLLLDEPTSHVDKESAEHIIGALIRARDNGTTIICATHDLQLARKIRAKILLMGNPS